MYKFNVISVLDRGQHDVESLRQLYYDFANRLSSSTWEAKLMTRLLLDNIWTGTCDPYYALNIVVSHFSCMQIETILTDFSNYIPSSHGHSFGITNVITNKMAYTWAGSSTPMWNPAYQMWCVPPGKYESTLKHDGIECNNTNCPCTAGGIWHHKDCKHAKGMP